MSTDDSWPEQLAPHQIVTRMYTLYALKTGSYNTGVMIYNDSDLSSGLVYSTGEVVVRELSALPNSIPESVFNTLLGGVTAVFGAILGFLLAIIQDSIRNRVARDEINVASYAYILMLLRMVHNDLKYDEFPGEALVKWRDMPIKQVGLYGYLRRSDSSTLETIRNLFDEVQSAEKQKYEILIAQSSDLIERLEKKLFGNRK